MDTDNRLPVSPANFSYLHYIMIQPFSSPVKTNQTTPNSPAKCCFLGLSSFFPPSPRPSPICLKLVVPNLKEVSPFPASYLSLRLNCSLESQCARRVTFVSSRSCWGCSASQSLREQSQLMCPGAFALLCLFPSQWKKWVVQLVKELFWNNIL